MHRALFGTCLTVLCLTWTATAVDESNPDQLARLRLRISPIE